jgi:hypothetical protein
MWFVGDTHGNWKHILWMVKQRGLKDTTIYHVGDIGVGFIAYDQEMDNLEWLNEQFKKFNIVFYGKNEANIRYGVDKRCYWTGEKFILDEDKLTELKPGDVDIVVTHTAPAFCYPRNDNGFAPIVEDFARNDGKLKTELTIERGKLNQMYELLNKTQTLDKWFYGHFHKHEITLEGNTEFVCLDINQLYDIVDYTDYEKEMNEKYGE